MDENGIANMVALYAVRNKAPVTLVDITLDDQQSPLPEFQFICVLLTADDCF
jgi:hypothetical protein